MGNSLNNNQHRVYLEPRPNPQQEEVFLEQSHKHPLADCLVLVRHPLVGYSVALLSLQLCSEAQRQEGPSLKGVSLGQNLQEVAYSHRPLSNPSNSLSSAEPRLSPLYSEAMPSNPLRNPFPYLEPLLLI